jgi:hypothetical protein
MNVVPHEGYYPTSIRYNIDQVQLSSGNDLHQVQHSSDTTFIRYSIHQVITFIKYNIHPIQHSSSNNLHQVQHSSGKTFIKYNIHNVVLDEAYYLMNVVPDEGCT